MKTVKIKKLGAGKWADPNTNIPQIEVEEGDVVEVSNELADMMCPNCAKDITAELAKEQAAAEKEAEEKAAKEKAEQEAKEKKEAEEKAAAEKAEKDKQKTPPAKDKEKAESK